MRAFIVRPFGVQQGIDFDRVQRELIEPALAWLRTRGISIGGGTTGEISRAGNIREDIFRLLAVSDLVIADVTIHNANAFYELGVRHALRPGHTHLIRAKGNRSKYPFDLQTERYFEYDLDSLRDDVEPFAQALLATLGDERDSPIFKLLKDLKPHRRSDLVKVPDEFREEVDRARNTDRRGDLRLLAHECVSFEWDQEGLALVGDAQFKLKAYEGAKNTFELLLHASRYHYHANWRLGTIYQRLAQDASGAKKADLCTFSEQAINRALSVAESRSENAELNALLGSNAKNRWIEDFGGGTAEERGRRALKSPFFETMLSCYMRAAGFDLNGHYAAINAACFLKAQIQLARRHRDIWDSQHELDPEGEIKRREDLVERMSANLRLSLRLDTLFAPFQPPADPWAASSIADLTLINDPKRTQIITARYRTANAEADLFALEANRRNLDIFKALDLFEPSASAALELIDDEINKRFPLARKPKHALLFTGHMIDAPELAAEKARFPRTAKAEQTARQLIYDAVKNEIGADATDTIAMAGCACGSDILFHEVCAELGIRTEIFLALPLLQFQRESVERGGAGWVARFQALCQKSPQSPRILQDSSAPPQWLATRKNYTLWERNNFWMVFSTLAVGAPKQTLIALFNAEREPEGAGGTRHLMAVANDFGLRTLSIDARGLLT
jgi:hypothetical protein